MGALEAVFATTFARPIPSAAVDTTAKGGDSVRRVAEEFESLFLGEMFEQMFAGLPTDGKFGGGYAESVYRSMLSQEYGTIIARNGGVGIADAVERQLLMLQEADNS